LTERQAKIAELAALGFSNARIALQLGLTPAVVRADLSEMYRRLDAGAPARTRCPVDGKEKR
jgi:DNA-binding NarL/FixJ family response regulator